MVKKHTTRTELVETHELAKSLCRLNNTVPYDSDTWKRAVYHAIGMAGCSYRDEMEKIREALRLP